MLDAARPRNRFASHMHGVLGNEGVDPATLLERGRAEIASHGVEYQLAAAHEVTGAAHGLEVILEGAALSTRALVLATGARDQLPHINGLAERWGHTVLHCPYCHGWEVRDQRLGVLITSPLQAHLPFLLRQLSDRVAVFASNASALDASTRARLEAREITVIDAGLTSLEGPARVLEYATTSAGERVPLDALFAGGTVSPHDAMLAGLDLERDESPSGSFLTIDQTGKTSHPRIWAAGNVVTPHANVPMSMGAGTMAGAAVNATLAEEDADASHARHTHR